MEHALYRKSPFDHARADKFSETLSAMLEHGAVAAMMSIGHRTGLFDVIAAQPPGTSREIAEASGLAERYVREWLAVMVVGGIVEYYPQSGRYWLPPEHAASLTRTAQLGNQAVYAQMIALFGASQERVLEGFRTGKGITYDSYPCFHQIMSEDSQQTVVDGICDTLNTLAQDLVMKLEAGIDVLDAGCGAGRAAIRLAELYPNSRFHGFDLCPDAIDMAEAKAASRQLPNVSFEVRDLLNLDMAGAFDLVTSFDAVHDTGDPQKLLCAIYLGLKPGGVHLMQDIGGSAKLENNMEFPFAALLYAISCVHCTPVSIAQGGEGLGAMWGWETAEAMLRAAGFKTSSRTVLPHDPMNVWFVNRKDD